MKHAPDSELDKRDQVLARIRQLSAVDTLGGRSYGAGGGGHGTFIVHTN
jgi:hypothetical protein